MKPTFFSMSTRIKDEEKWSDPWTLRPGIVGASSDADRESSDIIENCRLSTRIVRYHREWWAIIENRRISSHASPDAPTMPGLNVHRSDHISVSSICMEVRKKWVSYLIQILGDIVC